MSHIYMSFVNDTGFAGAVIVEAETLAGAIRVSWLKGINPGGEVMGIPVPDISVVPPSYINRLISREEIEQMDKEIKERTTA